MSKITVTFSTQRIGNLGYVLEEWSNGNKRQYEMPAAVVPHFVRARREAVNRVLTKFGAKKDVPDYSWLESFDAKVTQ